MNAVNKFRNWSPTWISIDRSGKRELAPRVCSVKISAAQTRRRVGGVDGGGINADVTMPPPSVIDRVARWRRHAYRQGRRYFGRHAPPSLTPSTSLPLRWRWWRRRASRPQWRSNLPPPRGLCQFALGVTCLRIRFRVSGIFWFSRRLVYRYHFTLSRREMLRLNVARWTRRNVLTTDYPKTSSGKEVSLLFAISFFSA